jgi:hypothetical protein
LLWCAWRGQPALMVVAEAEPSRIKSGGVGRLGVLRRAGTCQPR